MRRKRIVERHRAFEPIAVLLHLRGDWGRMSRFAFLDQLRQAGEVLLELLAEGGRIQLRRSFEPPDERVGPQLFAVRFEHAGREAQLHQAAMRELGRERERKRDRLRPPTRRYRPRERYLLGA